MEASKNKKNRKMRKSDMEFQEFTEAVLKAIKIYLDDGQEVTIQKIHKNNNIVLCGLSIFSKNSNVIPIIYMESFYELYKNDMPMKVVVKKIWNLYQKSLSNENIDMSFFRDFEKVKNRIIYRLINAERNRDLLEEIPHILFFDLAICFYYVFDSKELGEGMILIHNTYMEQWEVHCSQLLQLAEENTQRLFPIKFCDMMDVLKI